MHKIGWSFQGLDTRAEPTDSSSFLLLGLPYKFVCRLLDSHVCDVELRISPAFMIIGIDENFNLTYIRYIHAKDLRLQNSAMSSWWGNRTNSYVLWCGEGNKIIPQFPPPSDVSALDPVCLSHRLPLSKIFYFLFHSAVAAAGSVYSWEEEERREITIQTVFSIQQP